MTYRRNQPGSSSKIENYLGFPTGISGYELAARATNQAVDPRLIYHGFLRSATGAITSFSTFDAPGAGTVADQGTSANSINPAGVIAGYYLDASNVYHGFQRTP